MSNSLRPHRRQPTRLLGPWDSPAKNNEVGCHFLLQCMKVKSESEVTQSFLTLHNPMDYGLPGSSVHGIFPGKSTGVRCHCFLLIYMYIHAYMYKIEMTISIWTSQVCLKSPLCKETDYFIVWLIWLLPNPRVIFIDSLLSCRMTEQQFDRLV